MPPTDEEMIRHFATHEAAFDKIRKIMAESSEGSFHYPPLSPCDILILDSAGQISYQPNQVQDTPVHGLSRSDRIQLDSLLSEIGCGLVLVDRREWVTADSVYVRDVECSVPRPLKELKGYDKVYLKKGETKRVRILLDEEAFAYYDVESHRFVVEKGTFEILAGPSSADLPLKATVVL